MPHLAPQAAVPNGTSADDKLPPGDDRLREPKAVKVTMNLSQRDVDNTAAVREKFQSRSNAAAVSVALGVTKTLADIVDNGGEILVRNKDGQVERVIITGLG